MTKWTMSDMYCTQCGNKNIPIQRNKGKEREPGHLKKMYCIFCNKDVNMIEIRDFGKYKLNDFQLEFKLHNFDSDGNRKIPYDILKQQIYKGGCC